MENETDDWGLEVYDFCIANGDDPVRAGIEARAAMWTEAARTFGLIHELQSIEALPTTREALAEMGVSE